MGLNEWLSQAKQMNPWGDQLLTMRLREHSLFKAHDVAKVQTRRLEGLSVRDPALPRPTGKLRVWQGVRWSDDALAL